MRKVASRRLAGGAARFAWRKVWLAVTAGALLDIATAGDARAQFVLPDAEFRETITRFTGDTGRTLDLGVPESDSYTANHVGGGHSSAVSTNVRITSLLSPSFSGPILTISGNALNSGPNAVGFSSANAKAEVTYYFRVLAPPSVVSIPTILPVKWSLHVNVPNQGLTPLNQQVNGGVAQVRVDAMVRPLANPNAVNGTDQTLQILNAGEGFPGPFKIGEFTEADTELLTIDARNFNNSGEYYRVDLELAGFASRSTSAGNSNRNGTALFDAMLDPIPEVDPSYPDAASVTFELSDNIAVVPEPSSTLQLAIGACAVVLLRRRRTRGVRTSWTLGPMTGSTSIPPR